MIIQNTAAALIVNDRDGRTVLLSEPMPRPGSGAAVYVDASLGGVYLDPPTALAVRDWLIARLDQIAAEARP